MSATVIITSLLPIIFSNYQELKLISDLNNYFNFDHNIFLLDSSADKIRFITSTPQTPQSLYDFNNDNFTSNLELLTEIKSKNTLTIIVVPGISGLDKNFWLL